MVQNILDEDRKEYDYFNLFFLYKILECYRIVIKHKLC